MAYDISEYQFYAITFEDFDTSPDRRRIEAADRIGLCGTISTEVGNRPRPN
jgi:hypothetical protein